MKHHQLDPQILVFSVGPLPFPPLQLSGGWWSLSRLPYGAPKPRAALTQTTNPKTHSSGRGNGSSGNFRFLLAPSSASRWSTAQLGGFIGFY